MRLIKLRIKNIASLKEEHEINFEHIYNQSPLFAITGETGAGKSSILNAIGLVLYGKIYKSNVTQNDLVTLGEKEGQIELIFQGKGKNYLASWRAKVRKQNGEPYSTPQTPQRELYSLDGDDFASPKTILTTRVEDLLNLDFDQFCKCIILNQGEFARFLSSSFSERKEILEKLYPGEMLESLSRELRSELDVLQKQKNDLDIELSTLNGDGQQGEDLAILKASLEKDYKLHENWLAILEKIDFHYTTLSSYHIKYKDSFAKIETVKASLSKETSIFNEHLLLSQKASEELAVVRKDQEEQLPRLQELLKSEESLRHAHEKKSELDKALAKFSEQQTALSTKDTQLNERLRRWEAAINDLRTSITLPLDELKKHSLSFEELFEIYTKKETLCQDLINRADRLTQLEEQGKEEARELKELQSKRSTFEADKEALKTLEKKKKDLSAAVENKQRAIIRSEELKRIIEVLDADMNHQEKDLSAHKEELSLHQQEYLPLESTMKLQSLLSAVETCLTHPIVEETKSCPVCKSAFIDEQIVQLRQNLSKTDFTKIKIRESELSRLIMKRESEIHQLEVLIGKTKEERKVKTKEMELLTDTIKNRLPDLNEIETALREAQKRVWEIEKVITDEERLTLSLEKSRKQYGTLKTEFLQRKEAKENHEKRLLEIVSPISFIKGLTDDLVSELKAEQRKLNQLLELESQGEKLHQEKNFLQENLKEAGENLSLTKFSLADLESKIKELSTTLDKELGGKKASEIISKLGLDVKEKSDNLMARERELKTQELKLKELQGHLNRNEELMKEYDLHFRKELHALQEIGTHNDFDNADSRKLLKILSTLDLSLNSPEELFTPIKELLAGLKTSYKNQVLELGKSLGSVRARLEDWGKLQDRIQLLVLKSKDLTQVLERRLRLYEVLGKDELRTFVLSLVEENLITQTNDELQKLCQGRYEIIHQSKRMKLTPEFYILDKFREGGLRKVSTLSGGETFMVSLAMALGLAEMTRGKAEVESLFIDEGFGTLDQESLEDVLDMLKQIQNRGLMIGIISHVKALTSALPVNLLVSKRQDGTSKVGVVFN